MTVTKSARTKPDSKVAVDGTMGHTELLNCRRDRGGDDDGHDCENRLLIEVAEGEPFRRVEMSSRSWCGPDCANRLILEDADGEPFRRVESSSWSSW